MPHPTRRSLCPGVGLLLAALTLPAIAQAQPAPPEASPLDLPALMAGMATVPERHAIFREEKRLAALTVPLVSTGRLNYRRPGFLEKLTDAPAQERLVVDGDQVEMTSAGQPPRSFDLAQAPELRALVDSVRAPLAGDLATLRREFVMRASGRPSAWVLELSPLNARAANLLRLVRLAGSGTDLLEVVTVQANGDELTMQIRPQS